MLWLFSELLNVLFSDVIYEVELKALSWLESFYWLNSRLNSYSFFKRKGLFTKGDASY